MQPVIDDVRIKEIREVLTPTHVHQSCPISQAAAQTTWSVRQNIHHVLHGADDRLVVVIGPCSIHDSQAALEYAQRLKEQRERWSNELIVVMRVYFEKPRTTIGWKGLINDPHLDGSFEINTGLQLARRVLRDINELGVPCATEFLDMITPQYTADLVAWGAIGARTTESQVHRELASGLSCPIGFKNGTDGNVRIAIDAIRAASSQHHFLSVTKAGRSAIVSTAGNEDCHIILRGGDNSPNYAPASIEAVCAELGKAGLNARLMVDFSHANSSKQFKRQLDVARNVAAQISGGDKRIFGTMVESHLKEGRQELIPGKPLEYGQSITDSCIGWDDSLAVLHLLAEAVRQRRLGR
ncbi:MAG: 3-deoxy-7-phosphoheptulonate synthase AroG [Cystobacterineae bacterium]|nr:3-deoxy-7-phosphoheptulonate synthase AroG [Cystobacterineae bacterium]